MATFQNTLSLDVAPLLAALQKAAQQAKGLQDSLGGSIKPDITAAVAAFNQVEKEAKDASRVIVSELKEAGVAGGRALGDGIGKADIKGKLGNLANDVKSGLGSAFGASALGGIIGGGIAGAVSAGASAIVQGIGEVISIGSQFEQSVAGLSSITGQTGESLDGLAQRARDLAKEFGGDATTQVAAFQGILSKFGPALANTPNELGTISTNVNTLAKAAGLDAQGAMDALTNSMLQFGVNVSDAGEAASQSTRFINVLAKGAQDGAAEIPQVAQAILQAGVAAKGANVSFEETNAALQALAIGGKVGSEAGIGLRNVINLLIKGGSEQEKVLKKVGLSYAELGSTLTTKGLGAALEKLNGGLGQFGTAAEKSAALATLFGAENSSTAGILLQNTKTIKDFTASFTEAGQVQGRSGVAFQQAATNMATFSEFVSRAKANLADFAIEVFNGGKALGGFFVNILSGPLGKVVDQIKATFTTLFNTLKPILAIIGAAIITNIVVTITTIASVTRTVFDVVNRVFQGFLRAIEPLKKALEDAFGGFGDAADPMQIFTDALNIVTTIIVGAGEIIGEFAGLIIEFVTPGIQFLAQAIANVVKFFTGQKKETKGVADETKKAVPLIDQLKRFILEVRAAIAGATAGFREFKTILGEVGAAIANFDFGKALALLTGSGDRLKKAYSEGRAEVIKTKQAEEEAAAAAKKQEEAEQAAADAAGKKNKAKAKDGKTALELAKEALKAAQDELDLQQQAFETTIKEAAAKEGRSKLSDEELLRIEQNKLDLETKRIDKIKEILRLQTDDAGRVISTQVALVGKDGKREDVIEDLDDLLLEAREKAAQTQLSINAKIAVDPKEVLDQVKSAVKDANDTFKNLGEQLAESSITPDAFNQSVDSLAATLKNNKDRLEEQLAINPQVRVDPKIQKQFKDQIEELEKQITDLEAKAEAARAKSRLAGAKQRIEDNKLILDKISAERERAEKAGQKLDEKRAKELADAELKAKLAILDDQAAIELAGIKSVGDARIAEERRIVERLNLERSKLIATDATQATDFTKLADALQAGAGESAKILANAIQDLFGAFDDEESKRTAKLRDELNARQVALDAALAEGKVTYTQYVEELNKLDAQRTTQATSNAKTLEGDLAAIFQKVTSNLIPKQDETNKATEEQLAQLRISYKKGEITQKDYEQKSLAITKAREEKKTALEVAEQAAREVIAGRANKIAADNFAAFTKNADNTGLAFRDLAEAGAASFVALVASGEEANAALNTVLVQLIKSLVNKYIPLIFSNYLAFIPPPFNAIAATAAIAGLNSLVDQYLSGAESGVVGIDGSYRKRPGATDTIPLMVARGESIINAKATARERDLLKFINDGGSSLDWFRRNIDTSSFQQVPRATTGAVDTSELRALRAEVVELRRVTAGLGADISRRTEVRGELSADGDSLRVVIGRANRRELGRKMRG